MGCYYSTQSTLVEQVLIQAESDSGMKRLKSTDVDYVVRKNSTYGTVSVAQLLQITNALNLSMMNDDLARRGDFFQSFRHREKCDRDSLLVTLLLLSSSPTPRAKMELLFEVFDSKATGHLKANQLSHLFQLMLEAAIFHVPKLVSRRANVNKAELAGYLSRLGDRLILGTKVLTELVLCGRDQVTLIQFLEVVTDKTFDDVSRCEGLREFLMGVETVERSTSASETAK